MNRSPSFRLGSSLEGTREEDREDDLTQFKQSPRERLTLEIVDHVTALQLVQQITRHIGTVQTALKEKCDFKATHRGEFYQVLSLAKFFSKGSLVKITGEITRNGTRWSL